MDKHDFKIPITPPQQLPAVVERMKGAYKVWMLIHRDMARTERFGIGARIDFLHLDLLEILRKAAYTRTQDKPPLLSEALLKTDALRFFLQLAWETSLLATERYIPLGQEIEEIGRMVGGWKKGLLAKTPPIFGGEKRKE